MWFVGWYGPSVWEKHMEKKRSNIGQLYESTFQHCRTCGSEQFYVSLRRGKITITCIRCHLATEYSFDKSTATFSQLVNRG